MFTAFYTGFIEEQGYGGKIYFTEHPQLSHALIDALLEKKDFHDRSGLCRDQAGERAYPQRPVLCGQRRVRSGKSVRPFKTARGYPGVYCLYLSHELCRDDRPSLQGGCENIIFSVVNHAFSMSAKMQN